VKDLSFSFPGRENLFEGVNFIIKKGTLSLLIGHIGTGKTTLLQILQKFYYPSKGAILVDNIDFTDIDIRIWRSQIGIVPQEIKIFNENLAFNICLSDDENEIESVEDFCRRHKFDAIFNLLPQYDTMLGETGVKLSGGQKQILGLARALFKKPQFLLLDEPTSSLDPLTESFILTLLTELKTEIGMLLITHNTKIGKYADNVYTLKNEPVANC
jgi:ATP-binding cassette subfamily B protein